MIVGNKFVIKFVIEIVKYFFWDIEFVIFFFMIEGIGNYILIICEILGIVNRSNFMYCCLLNGLGSIIFNDGSWLMV